MARGFTRQKVGAERVGGAAGEYRRVGRPPGAWKRVDHHGGAWERVKRVGKRQILLGARVGAWKLGRR
jgi:hypothetical protein